MTQAKKVMSNVQIEKSAGLHEEESETNLKLLLED